MTRALLVLLLLGGVAAIIFGATWKQRVIAWHVHEYRRLRADDGQSALAKPSVIFHVLNHLCAFPGDEYFDRSRQAREDYHFDALIAIGYLDECEFWVHSRSLHELADFPGNAEPVRWAYSMRDGQSGYCLGVIDSTDRMSLWKLSLSATKTMTVRMISDRRWQ
jgi:hypothetical protein